jgi:predicted metal-dependent peptidase
MLSPTTTDFNLDRHLISLLQDASFFAELSRHITKVPTLSIPTAAVAFNEKTDNLTLFWNPYFFGGGEYTVKAIDLATGAVVDKPIKYEALSDWEIRGVLVHEFYHLVFGHLYGRRRKPADLWNVATDLAINSIIIDSAKTGASKRLEGDRPLPEFCLFPGVFPKKRDGSDFAPEEKAGMKLATIIEKLPTMQSSEWYFDKIQQEAEAAGETAESITGGGGIDSMDDHDAWDSVPDDMKEYVEGKVKSLVEKAAKHADSQAGGWGNIPADIVDDIRRSVASVINWKTVLRQFVGQLVRGGRTTSIKRINKRYPYIHPGVKRSYEAKLLVAIDMSGSVHNEMLVEFFGELGCLTKKVSIDVLPFDCSADVTEVFPWRRGQNVSPKRTRTGGTDFNAPTRVANDPKNRGRWDGMLIMTDGECSAPVGSRVKRGWVIGKGQKMMFETSELVVQMNGNESTVKGAWR